MLLPWSCPQWFKGQQYFVHFIHFVFYFAPPKTITLHHHKEIKDFILAQQIWTEFSLMKVIILAFLVGKKRTSFYTQTSDNLTLTFLLAFLRGKYNILGLGKIKTMINYALDCFLDRSNTLNLFPSTSFPKPVPILSLL